MLKAELLEVIRNGEGSGVEFKRDTIDNRALRKAGGLRKPARGRLLLGVMMTERWLG